ncbi:MAG: hypothetical protein RBU27_00685 [Bacteroidota bacterium]|jgi:hypothetical protein|nr:hypothetical protein [Bacteroidota bacterium]
MKSLLLLTALLLCSLTAAAQEQPRKKEPATRNQPAVTQQGTTTGAQQGFVDEDGDGINDRGAHAVDQPSGSSQRQRLRVHRRDHFIDQDGDGIHDERCGGTGLRRTQRHGAAKGGTQ